ncbi:carnitine acetyl transferase [Phellopilus nigrolimitatus]|nr:carnitine acetyl transferase [Phellopilus nigrolimitatus]
MSTPPAHWKRLAPHPPAGSTTVASQNALPHLPVPALQDTLTRLRGSLRPLAHSEDELRAAEKKIADFEGGLARELHARLVKRQEETEHWLEEWWDSGAYMGYRDSVVVNVSYFYGFDAHPPQYPRGPVHRAAALTRATLLFRQMYKTGALKPEGTKDGSICMDTYRWMFDCCRVPGSAGLDWAVSYAKEGEQGNAGHVIVLRKNRVWKVDAAKDGTLLSTADLEKQFQNIYDNTTHDYPAVGLLSTSNRDVWAKDYVELVSDPVNEAIIREIHSSAFLVCLDDIEPRDAAAFSRQLWHGGASGRWLANRWVDKPVELIVCDGADAKAGIMGEHSVMDGTPTARMCDDVLDMLASPSFNHGTPSPSPLASPVALDWRISPTTKIAVTRARDAARALTDGQALIVLTTTYGKGAIKRFGVSPDSWAQMLVQLAYARLLRARGQARQGATYEAASTRRFFKGRTETIRVVSAESDAWVRAMDDESADDGNRVALLQEAAKRHIQLAKDAGNAQGVDRHLFGLKKLVKEGEEVPALFSDPLVVRSSHWVLSTSAVFSKHFDAYGWGEVVPDGFGVAYMTGFEDKLFFNLTSRTEMPLSELAAEIERAAQDMYDLFSKQEQKARL